MSKELFNPSDPESLKLLEKRAFFEGWPMRQDTAFLSRSQKVTSRFKISSTRTAIVQWLRIPIGSKGSIDIRPLGKPLEYLFVITNEAVALSTYGNGDNVSKLAIIGESDGPTGPSPLLMVTLPGGVELEFPKPSIVPGSCLEIVHVPDEAAFELQ